MRSEDAQKHFFPLSAASRSRAFARCVAAYARMTRTTRRRKKKKKTSGFAISGVAHVGLLLISLSVCEMGAAYSRRRRRGIFSFGRLFPRKNRRSETSPLSGVHDDVSRWTRTKVRVIAKENLSSSCCSELKHRFGDFRQRSMMGGNLHLHMGKVFWSTYKKVRPSFLALSMAQQHLHVALPNSKCASSHLSHVGM